MVPKYRLPIPCHIDFNSCKREVASVLYDFDDRGIVTQKVFPKHMLAHISWLKSILLRSIFLSFYFYLAIYLKLCFFYHIDR